MSAERLTEEEFKAIRRKRDDWESVFGLADLDALLSDRAALVKRVEELEGALLRARVRLQVTLDCDNSRLCDGCCGLIENDIRAAAKALAGETHD